jgi:hypothetical protein
MPSAPVLSVPRWSVTVPETSLPVSRPSSSTARIGRRQLSVSYVQSWQHQTAAWRILLGAILSLLVSFSVACSTKLHVRAPLPGLDTPPASIPTAVLKGVVTDGCPAQLVCLTPDAAVALGVWIKEARAWMLVTFLRCGLAPGVEEGSFGSSREAP